MKDNDLSFSGFICGNMIELLYTQCAFCSYLKKCPIVKNIVEASIKNDMTVDMEKFQLVISKLNSDGK